MIPKVSIITVSYNSEKTIRDTIESVLSQSYSNLEYIIIDGGSIDKTLNIISEYSSNIIKVVSERDNGIYDAMNKGIKLASGDIIGMLNSDDLYTSNSILQEVVDIFRKSCSDCVFADLIVVNRNDTNKILRYYDSSHFSIAKFKYGWMPAHPTFFTYKSIYSRVGKYSTDYQIASDFEMLLRILYKNSYTYSYYPKVIVKMRHGGKSSGGLQKSLMLNSEIIKACRRNGIKTNYFVLLLKIPRKIFEYVNGIFIKNFW